MILLWPNNRSPIINKVELHYLGGFCGVMMVIGQLIRRGMTWLNKHLKSWWLVLITIISVYLSIYLLHVLSVGVCVRTRLRSVV